MPDGVAAEGFCLRIGCYCGTSHTVGAFHADPIRQAAASWIGACGDASPGSGKWQEALCLSRSG